MKEYEIHKTYLRHDGGTKFYETILLYEKGNGPAMLIKRWGDMAKVEGMGQTKFHKGSYSLAKNEEDKILKDKRASRPGKGQYIDDTTLVYGLHAFGLSKDIIPADRLSELLEKHYKDYTVVAEIVDYFGLSDIVAQTGEDFIVEGDMPEKPEIDRGTTWASW